MPISFSEKENRQKYLAILLIVIVSITLFVLRKNIFKTSSPGLPAAEVFQPQKIEINFEVLKNSKLKELQPPKEASPFVGKAGRANPFISY